MIFDKMQQNKSFKPGRGSKMLEQLNYNKENNNIINIIVAEVSTDNNVLPPAKVRLDAEDREAQSRKVSSDDSSSNHTSDIIENTPSPRPIGRNIGRPISKTVLSSEESDSEVVENNEIFNVLSDIDNVSQNISSSHKNDNDVVVSLEDDLYLSDDSVADPDWKNPEDLATENTETDSGTETVQSEVVPPKKIKTARWHKRRIETYDRNAQKRNRSQSLPYKNYKKQTQPPKAPKSGKVSIADIFFWFVPATPDDVELTELTIEHWNGRYSHAIFSEEGGWPKKLEKFLLENGRREGYPHPRLPPFTPEEIDLVRGTYDFYGLNYYTTRQVRKAKPGETPDGWPFYGSKELNIIMESNPSWKSTELDWLSMYPVGLREQLQWLHTNYDVKEIIIMENGMATFDPSLADIERVEFIKGHLEQILLAINDGVPVTGYTAWTIMDNFEWYGGYGAKFGLYAVDFNEPNRTRTPRESARFYANVAKTRILHTGNDQNIL